MMKGFLRAFSCLTLLLAGAALATTLLAQDVPALTRGSAAVLRGKVVKVEARLTRDGARIMTDATIEVQQAYKGAPASTVVVMQPGGEVDGLGQHVEGVAHFSVGEEVVLFLEARGERYLVAGMAQGKWKVERTGPTPLARPQSLEGAVTLDPISHLEVSRSTAPINLTALEGQIRGALPSTTPAPTGTVSP
jgi:hypothetical protein